MAPPKSSLFLVAAIAIVGGLRLEDHLQPDDVDRGGYDDLDSATGHLCTRRCATGDTKLCYYKFTIENYSAMGPACGNCPANLTDCENRYCVTGNGVHRNMVSVNRRLPGPAIQVCKGDTVVIDVSLAAAGRAATLHWHGQLQRSNPYMDGVYMVTQCPITPGQTFRYSFTADQPGTHYWHDHTGLIKQDGVQGPLVIRQPPGEEDGLWDEDLPSHVVFLSDWKQYLTDDEIPDLKTYPGEAKPDSLLINGKASFNKGGWEETTRYRVERGRRYLLRGVGGMCMECAVQFSVQGHRLTVVASDGNPLQPYTVDALTLLTGERYDVVVETNQEVGLYWMEARAVEPCDQAKVVRAVLEYTGAQGSPPPPPPTLKPSHSFKVLNRPNMNARGKGRYNTWVSELVSKGRQTPTGPPQYVRLVQFSSYTYSNRDFTTGAAQNYYQPVRGWKARGAINNITGVVPPAPLLSQPEDFPKELFCSDRCLEGRSPETCLCFQMFHFPLNTTVDFIVTDTSAPDGTVHPFHMHGHSFWVLEQGVLGRPYREAVDLLERRVTRGLPVSHSPPFKDTVMVPSGGYTVLRFTTDNPGIWAFHCHYMYHNAVGMNAYMMVGERSDFPPPPAGFPRCSNFLPPVDDL